ncbi:MULTISPECIES: phosphoribosylanthranilate isomerase [Proteiniphilum]|jgi:phosphoribosylanthranilate isomerase|uniref:phosphoribosylanthranilate isomerase n=1 Tax=Proteiniphilum TaxID=294702 RepID=UPI001EECE0DC|nr:MULTISPECIES: phosphoribosylanthranilate isomerase [Proteiniphilum]ULB35032.1 phosphoribosylanthranilate isomerase [Proteiniphilum propionicum]
MIIKVCGMRDEENIRKVEQLGVDWMGFIFYRKSLRYTGGKLAYIPEKVKRVGIFVDEDIDSLLALADNNRLQILQLHGNESPAYCNALRDKGFSVIKSFGISIDEPFPIVLTERYEGCCDYFLFDTKSPLYGGTGRKFNRELLLDYRGGTPFLLSGGISPEDAESVKYFSHPKYIGIDVNSRFEIAPAIKDIELIRILIEHFR